MIQHQIKEREPQHMDMKEIIAEAARKLILEKKVKKQLVAVADNMICVQLLKYNN